MSNPTISKYRDRHHLLELFVGEGFKIGCEVGVWIGDFSEKMLETIPNLKLYLVDPYGKSHKRLLKRGGFSMVEARTMVHKRFKGKNVVFIEKTSLEAASLIKHGTLDFVYIDANHKYRYVMIDIIKWSPKVRKGGIVSGHDYNYQSVTEAVNDYARLHNIQFSITGERSPIFPSWFWRV